MKKIKPSDLRREAQAMILDGSMPSLETLLEAVADAREKYAKQIRASRKLTRLSKENTLTNLDLSEITRTKRTTSVSS
jgi:uncharacterized linocin/CFP29 family protein